MPAAAVSVDAYLAGFPPPTRAVLEEARRRVLAALPGAQEWISYQIPTFGVDGQYVLYLAGWRAHVSLYPIPDGDAELMAALTPYLSGRGTIKLPLNQPIPWDLVDRAIAAQVASRVPQIDR